LFCKGVPHAQKSIGSHARINDRIYFRPSFSQKKKNPKHLKDLKCAVNEIAKFNGIKWKCELDEDTGDTLGDLSCDPSQIAEYDGIEWFCSDKEDSGSPVAPVFILKDNNGQQVGQVFEVQAVVPRQIGTLLSFDEPNGEIFIDLIVTSLEIPFRE